MNEGGSSDLLEPLNSTCASISQAALVPQALGSWSSVYTGAKLHYSKLHTMQITLHRAHT